MKKETMIEWMTEGHVSVPKVLFKHYPDVGLSESECMLILHIHAFLADGNVFPTPKELSERMTVSSEKCSSMLRGLIQKGLLSLQRQEIDGIYSESYSLLPLWEKLLFYFFKGEENPSKRGEDLFTMFEREFGRPLSPLECEQISAWIDQDEHSDELIKAALKEAVMAGVLNFRYLDRILLEWKKNGIQTPEQAKVYGEKFRRRRPKTEESKKDPFPFYNWLEK